MVDDNQEGISLNGTNAKPAAPVAAPKAAAAPAKPADTSTFLTRIANTAIREGSPAGAAPSASNPRWMSIDHSSPAANLNSRPDGSRAHSNRELRPSSRPRRSKHRYRQHPRHRPQYPCSSQ